MRRVVFAYTSHLISILALSFVPGPNNCLSRDRYLSLQAGGAFL